MSRTDDYGSSLFDDFSQASSSNSLAYALGVSDTAEANMPQSPRKPRLWVRIIGVIGELMICAGSVLALFIVWQIWWTNLEVSDVQDKAVQELQQQFGKIDKDKIGTPQAGDPPAVEAAMHGDVIGLMHIPALGTKQSTPIHEGESLDMLNIGVFGHYKDTAMPGGLGNFSTAIHRDTYGARVLHIDELRVGDPIVVETENAWLVYKFTDYEIVKPTDVYVVSADPYAAKASPDPNNAATEPSGRYLTITTCHPPLVSSDRWIVHAKFDHWVARNDGLPQELAGESQQAHTDIEQTGTSIRDALNDAFKGVQESVSPQESAVPKED